MVHQHRHHHYHHPRDAHTVLPDAMSSTDLPQDASSSPVHRPPVLSNLFKRSPASSADESSKSCGPGDNSGVCEKSVSDTTSKTLPIALGVAIPVTAAIIILFFLHRRQVRKLRREDAADNHNSADFGLDHVSSGKKGGKKKSNRWMGRSKNDRAGMPEANQMSMADTEKSIRGGGDGRVSLDMPTSNPYFLPPELHGSQESFHSLSRTFHGRDDRYRGATAFPPRENGSNGSARSFPTAHSKPTVDDASSYTAASSRRQHGHGDDMNRDLLGNAQRMSKTPPPPPLKLADNGSPLPSQQPRSAPYPTGPADNHALVSSPEYGPDRSLGNSPAPQNNDSVVQQQQQQQQSQDYLPTFLRAGSPPPPPPPSKDAAGDSNQLPPRGTSLSSNPQSIERPPANSVGMPPLPEPPASSSSSSSSPPPPENDHRFPPQQSQQAPLPQISLTVDDDDDKSDYGDHRRLSVNPHSGPSAQRKSMAEEDIYDQYAEPDRKRMTMGLRPLPPDEPTDSPEQRANRIRSFYKEYFDDSKPFNEGDYYGYYENDYDYGDDEEYDYDYYGDMHWQEPMMQDDTGRRAMTPPPRIGGGRFGPGPRNQGAASAIGHHHPGFSSMSSGPPGSGPRAFSSASARGPGAMPRKPRPPPAPLHELPTPHKLKEGNEVLPIDYAPAQGPRDRRAGRPETPQGGLRPYSPAVPAHTPLASSYDDLAAMPSPFALRKSGTFTGLDFAPPPRFRDDGTVSGDAGSMRSNRSGAMSPAQVFSVRSGANRVSRLPTETVSTKGDVSNLHPTWDMHR